MCPCKIAVPWAVASAHSIEICVTAPAGVHMQTYTIHVGA